MIASTTAATRRSADPVRPPSIPPADAESWTIAAPDGVRLRIYRLLQGPADGPVLLWGHANGFAAGSYLPFLQELGRTFRVFAFDARGHGGSDPPMLPLEQSLHIDRYARDLALVAGAVRECVGAAPLFFASHSFSGVAALRLGAIFGEAPWAGVTLFEPPLVPTPDLPEHAVAIGTSSSLVAQADRRRRRWANPAAFEASLAPRPPYSGFRPDMLHAHCRAILQPTGAGDHELSCAPEVEMATYNAVLNATTFRALPRFPLPVHLVAGDPAPTEGPPSWAALVQGLAAARLQCSRLTVLTGAGHMMVFERPDTCRDLVLDMLDGRSTNS